MHIFLLVFILTTNIFAWQFFGFGDVRKKEVLVRTVLPMETDYEKPSARASLNSIREAAGLNGLLKNDLLMSAAQAHADYLVANKESSHYEVKGHQKFTGTKPVDRTLHANYVSRHISENLSTSTYSAQESIDGLFSAIYHRFAFLSESIDAVGVGVAQDKQETSNRAFVYVMANSNMEVLCHRQSFRGVGKYYYKICKDEKHRISQKAFEKADESNKKYNPKVILYPYDGQEAVPPVFYDETPDPLPSYEVSGFPVSIVFNDYFFKKIKLYSFKLYNQKGNEVKETLFMDKNSDPHHHFTSKQFALFPLKRLTYASTYRAEVVYVVKDKIHTISWHFSTQQPMEELHTIEGRNAIVHLKKGKSHMLYCVPEDGHDVLKNIQFPSDVDIVFTDHNTLKITVMNEDLDDFEIKSGERVIHVIME